MCHKFFDEEGIRRLEGIVERTFEDLAIDGNAPYAQQTREHIARLLFQFQLDQWPMPLASEMLTCKARQADIARDEGRTAAE
jgi:hypothetical protein